MLFNSHAFIFGFFPLVLTVYLLLARKSVQASIVWLALASLFFYATGELHYVWLLPVSVLLNYFFGHAIRSAKTPAAAKSMLTLGVVVDLLVLGVFKYSGFMLAQLSDVGLISPVTLNIVLPVGVSFYTFTQIAYLVDIYREQKSEGNPIAYLLFVSYYPHLIAGPILHHKEMMPQFQKPRLSEPFVAIFAGLAMFTIGLAKKVLIADPAGAIASGVFGASELGLSFFDAWMGAIGYTVQIYFDFSAYSDMAIGISYAMGISLPINFNSPYKSTNIIEFWRRWHITLSRFLRDYLYIALGGNRKGPKRRHLNLFLTMLLGGLWHGANWTFVVWGALHGGMLFIAHGFRDFTAQRPSFRLPLWAAWALTQLAVIIAWVPFRATNLHNTLAYWKSMLGLSGFAIPDIGGVRQLAERLGVPVNLAYFGITDVPLLMFALLVAWLAPNSQEIMRRFKIGLDSPGYRALPSEDGGRLVARVNWQTALVVGLLLALSVRCIGGYSEFIYFQF